MTPDRRYPICQLCGARHEPAGGTEGTVPAFACSGPRVSWSGEPRVLRDVELVSWGPDYAGFTGLVQAGQEEVPDE